MSGERHAIEHPLFVDFARDPVPPLKTVLQETYSPVGDVIRLAAGTTAVQNDWYTEVAIAVPAIDGFAIVYIIPVGKDFGLVAASMDAAFEPFFQLMSGPDHGDGVTKLVARHWPDVYEMLVRSNGNNIDGRILGNVITQGRAQWVVAQLVRDADRESFDGRPLWELIRTTVEVSLLATDPVGLFEKLPGLIQVLGGPDRTTRRLKALSGLLEAPAGFAKLLEGGIDPSEWIKLGDQILGTVGELRALKD